jgi:serine/threonine-protein kinase
VDAERFARAEALFHGAEALAGPEREAFLARETAGDAALRAEVESLLAAAEGRPAFLEQPAVAAVAPVEAAEPELELPATLGPYRLLSEIGRGGMGRVYLAEQATEAFRRQVAIKLLAGPGLFRERFRAEQRILAALEHPGIARLYDAGTAPDGRLFLALEYVEGETLTAHAAARGLGLAARLRLFGEVCAAVDYAHRHLVVHRDLKPANILVTAAGEPKLLDFGIAKLLQPETGAASETIAALRWMTPEYASPEQVRGEAISTASDVYSLGVILYELLTGERPYRLTTRTPEEASRAVLEQEPRRPSTAASSDGGVPAVERRRLRGDLDTIVLKALAKDPARRYASAAALAEDLRRHLEGRPVHAQPDRLGYRARKFVRRHLAGVAAGALAAVSLIAGLGAALWQARIARGERDRARIEAAKANETARFLSALFENADPARARGERLTVREVLDRGAARLGRDLEGQPEVRASLLALIGSVYRDLGLLDPARRTLEEARRVAEAGAGGESLATAQALAELAALQRLLGDLETGRAAADRALAIRERRLGPEHPEVARTLATLALFDRNQGARPEARRKLERALAIAERGQIAPVETAKWLNHLGLIQQDLGELETAVATYRRALEQLERAEGPESPLLALPLDNLGMTLRALGRLEESRGVLERALAQAEKGYGTAHSQYGTALNSLGNVLLDLGRHEEARERFRAAAVNYERALGSESHYLPWPITNEALCLMELKRPGEALALFRRALALREKSYGAEHWEVASSHADVGLALAALGDRGGAEAAMRRAVAIGRRVIVPPTPTFAELAIYLAELLAEDRRDEEARALFEEALGILRAAYPPGHGTVVRCEQALAAIAVRHPEAPAKPAA